MWKSEKYNNLRFFTTFHSHQERKEKKKKVKEKEKSNQVQIRIKENFQYIM